MLRPTRLLSLVLLGLGSSARPASHADERTCAQATTRLLGSLVGDYEVLVQFRSGPNSWDSSAARSRFGYELGGCLLTEHFQGHRYGEPYDYVALFGTAGAEGGRVQRVFAHSQHGLLSLASGNWNQAGDSLVFEDSALVRGTWIRQRYQLVRSANDELSTEGRRSEDGGRTWFSTMQAHYTRVAGAP
jgi:hypothetical protein